MANHPPPWMPGKKWKMNMVQENKKTYVNGHFLVDMSMFASMVMISNAIWICVVVCCGLIEYLKYMYISKQSHYNFWTYYTGYPHCQETLLTTTLDFMVTFGFVRTFVADACNMDTSKSSSTAKVGTWSETTKNSSDFLRNCLSKVVSTHLWNTPHPNLLECCNFLRV